MDLDFFRNVFTPLVLGSASFIVMLTTRNASLSDRVRGCTRLINDDKPNMEMLRRVNLLDQVDVFQQRLILNEYATALLATALILFLVMNLFAGNRSFLMATILFYCGLITLICGFLLTAVDIARSTSTLNLEVEYAKRLYKPDPQYMQDLRRQLVEWLKADAEYAQVMREAMQEATASTSLEEVTK